jgi:hypothetical protein
VTDEQLKDLQDYQAIAEKNEWVYPRNISGRNANVYDAKHEGPPICGYSDSLWEVRIVDDMIYGAAVCANFSMDEFMTLIGIDKTKAKWGEAPYIDWMLGKDE